MSIPSNLSPLRRSEDIRQPPPSQDQEMETTAETKAPPPFAAASRKFKLFGEQFKQDMGAFAHMAFAPAIAADRYINKLQELKKQMEPDKTLKTMTEKEEDLRRLGNVEKEIKKTQGNIAKSVIASIFIMPFTALLTAPLLPLWTLLSMSNASVKAHTGKTINENLNPPRPDDWNIKE